MTDLHAHFEHVLSTLPIEAEAEMRLTAESLPEAPAELSAKRLIALGYVDMRYYDTMRCDVVQFSADKQSYRALGLLAFAALFHGSRHVVELGNPTDYAAQRAEGARTLSRLIVDARPPLPNELSELTVVPMTYSYWPRLRESTHPLASEDAPWGVWRDSDRPSLAWSTINLVAVPPCHPERTVLHWFGTMTGTARLAAALLDFGLPDSELEKLCLEGPHGWQSVSARSDEVVSIGYPAAI